MRKHGVQFQKISELCFNLERKTTIFMTEFRGGTNTIPTATARAYIFNALSGDQIRIIKFPLTTSRFGEHHLDTLYTIMHTATLLLIAQDVLI